MRWLPLVLVAACSTIASKGDYRDYRRVRMTETEIDRLVAMRTYLENHPEGRWSDEVRAEREGREESLFDEMKSTAQGLRYYLEAYPEGRYAGQAEARLAALSSVQSNRQGEQEQAREVRRQQREEQLAERRQWATQAVQFWSRVLLGVQNWGRPIAEVAAGNEAFDDAFGSNPRPHCALEESDGGRRPKECVKFYLLDFAIPIPGQTRIERELHLQLRLLLRDGNLVRAEMLMPDRGFSRWYELQTQNFVIDQDPAQRQETVDWALEHIVPIIRELAPTAQGIDVVPEPISPLGVRPPSQPEPGASHIPGVEDASPGETHAHPTDETAETSMDALVLPIALQGLRAGPLRIVVFAAAEDDEGPAYDGLFIELEQPAEE